MPPYSAILLDDSFPLSLSEPFTVRDARRAGLSGKQLTALVGSGHLRRLVRGVYVAAQVPDRLDLRCRALGLVVPDDCFVSDLTASGERAVLQRDLMVVQDIVATTPMRTALDLGRLQRSRDMRLWGLDCMLGLHCFELEELLVAAEYDGEQWHAEDRSVHDGDRREWLREHRGWEIEVFRATHVFGRKQDADRRLRVAVAAARRSLGRRTFIV